MSQSRGIEGAGSHAYIIPSETQLRAQDEQAAFKANQEARQVQARRVPVTTFVPPAAPAVGMPMESAFVSAPVPVAPKSVQQTVFPLDEIGAIENRMLSVMDRITYDSIPSKLGFHNDALWRFLPLKAIEAHPDEAVILQRRKDLLPSYNEARAAVTPLDNSVLDEAQLLALLDQEDAAFNLEILQQDYASRYAGEVLGNLPATTPAPQISPAPGPQTFEVKPASLPAMAPLPEKKPDVFETVPKGVPLYRSSDGSPNSPEAFEAMKAVAEQFKGPDSGLAWAAMRAPRKQDGEINKALPATPAFYLQAGITGAELRPIVDAIRVAFGLRTDAEAKDLIVTYGGKALPKMATSTLDKPSKK